jgi:hypothetical protein
MLYRTIRFILDFIHRLVYIRHIYIGLSLIRNHGWVMRTAQYRKRIRMIHAQQQVWMRYHNNKTLNRKYRLIMTWLTDLISLYRVEHKAPVKLLHHLLWFANVLTHPCHFLFHCPSPSVPWSPSPSGSSGVPIWCILFYGVSWFP